MALQQIGEALANAYRRCADTYNNNGTFRALTNTAVIYAIPKAIAHVIGGPDLETAVDVLAPIMAGGYLMSETRGMGRNSTARDAAIVGIAAVMGADIAHHLAEYHGHMFPLDSARYAVQEAHDLVSKLTHINCIEATGAVTGAAGATIARIGQGAAGR